MSNFPVSDREVAQTETLLSQQEPLVPLPAELSALLSRVCCVHDETYHIVQSRSSLVTDTLQTPQKPPQQSHTEKKIPLPNDLFTALQSALGYDETGETRIRDIDHDAFWMALSSIVLNPRVFAELNWILTDVAKLSLWDLAKTDWGARAIFKLIEKKVITIDNKWSLETILPDLSKTHWGGYVIWEMIEGNILTMDNQQQLMALIPDLKTTQWGDHVLCAMIERGICTMQEAGKNIT